MAIPSKAVKWPEAMDPADLVDFTIDLRDAAKPLLEPGEAVAVFDLVLPVEAVALGLVIEQGSGRDPVLISGGDSVRLWLSIDGPMREDPAFDKGASLPVQITVTTDSSPSRRRQRTLLVEVIQQ
jgi:hypothetical protein